MATNNSISLFLPCYNEGETIEAVVKRSSAVLSALTEDFEIIIIDDGSSDRTRGVIERVRLAMREVKVVRHSRNRGYGAAIRSGITASSKEIVCFMDSDGQFDVAEIEILLGALARYDIVAGYRVRRQDPLYRRVNAYLFNRLVRRLFGLTVADVDCGMKVFKRGVFEIVKPKANGAFINAEIVIRAKAAGFAITEVGVNHFARRCGEQTGAKLHVIVCAFKELFGLYRELRALRRIGVT